MEIAGYIASVFIGITLGLIGGGGSILTVPVLVYLFAVDAVAATTYSLFIVGATSVVGSVSYFNKGLVDIKTAVFFGIPSILSVFLTRMLILPAIPQQILSTPAFTITKDVLLLLLFAILMVFASYSMIRKKSYADTAHSGNENETVKIIFWGLFIGMITGLIGAGGGFLIIPALVNLLRLPMKTAIGTSLLIISVNSLTGFLFSLSYIPIRWGLVLSIAAIAIAGILAGSYLATKIDGKKLKPTFGWFVLAMGIYIILRETLFK
ncbi:MAG: sulfite exporter TauE/SafE family protein [Bacteroidetes bacterium]|nr:sulfite exporter TauE/SafE family protein [Bacteroidota bacterium]